jgi:phenylacetate-CoA ligase
MVKTTMIGGVFFQVLNLRLHHWHNRDFSAKTAAIRVLRGSHIRAAKTGRGLPWANAHKSGPMTFLDLRTPVDQQLEWLKGQKAEYILTYPSNLMALLQLCRDGGAAPPNLRHVATMGEVLDPEVRRACEEIWQVPVVDAYSAQEVGMIGLQCPDHPHYHIQSENLLVEILDADGNPSPPGTVGRVVITDLHNFATPLIRYEIGDHAEVGEACSCGRGLPVITQVAGRTRNLVTLPTGERFSQGFSLFKLGELPMVRRVQMVQKTVEDIEVRLVADRPLTGDEEAILRRIVTDGLGHPFNVTLAYVEKIERTAGGKFEEFVSEVSV